MNEEIEPLEGIAETLCDIAETLQHMFVLQLITILGALCIGAVVLYLSAI